MAVIVPCACNKLAWEDTRIATNQLCGENISSCSERTTHSLTCSVMANLKDSAQRKCSFQRDCIHKYMAREYR